MCIVLQYFNSTTHSCCSLWNNLAPGAFPLKASTNIPLIKARDEEFLIVNYSARDASTVACISLQAQREKKRQRIIKRKPCTSRSTRILWDVNECVTMECLRRMKFFSLLKISRLNEFPSLALFCIPPRIYRFFICNDFTPAICDLPRQNVVHCCSSRRNLYIKLFIGEWKKVLTLLE